MPLGGMGCLWGEGRQDVQVGADVAGRNLDQIIFGAPGEGDVTTEAYLLNRANEMVSVPGRIITAADLHDCLSDLAMYAYLYADVDEFYLFSPDGKKLVAYAEGTRTDQGTVVIAL